VLPHKEESVADADQPDADQPDAGKAPFVVELVHDPNQPPDIVVLEGFLGDGPNNETARLYRRRNLQDWIDVPKNAILHQEPRPPDGVAIWIGSKQALRYTRTESISAKEFLSGPIADAYITSGMEAAHLGYVDPRVAYIVTRYRCTPRYPCVYIVKGPRGVSGPVEFLGCGEDPPQE
jgi:hypothetical protein